MKALVAPLAVAALLAVPAAAQAPSYRPSVESFVPIVGDWQVVEDGGRKVLRVDGRTWKRGNPAAGVADRARAIYGSKHEEFIDNVKAFAYFPYAVAKDVPDFTDGELRVRFKLIGGALDQCAGILFDLKPNGDYFTVRFNQKEDNLVLWVFRSGKRSFVKKNVHDVPLPMNEWHAIRLKFTGKGKQMEAFLDDEKLIDYTFENPIAGKVGVWSKTDSVSAFDEYEVIPAK